MYVKEVVMVEELQVTICTTFTKSASHMLARGKWKLI
jgi:hypothetical protein